MLIGYARVSTDGQSLDAQLPALKDAGCERVFAEKINGAETRRASLARSIAALVPQPPDPVRSTEKEPNVVELTG
jgi:DNA invertase Pin-like site-specific DNA recombinase